MRGCGLTVTPYNRETGARVMLDYRRGLKNATLPGTPPVLLLTVPAIPAMLATARYLGVLSPQGPYPPHVLHYHGFGAMADIVGQHINAVLIVHEDRQHRLFLDRVLGRAALPTLSGLGGQVTDLRPRPASYSGPTPTL
jgi:hypothetical protein